MGVELVLLPLREIRLVLRKIYNNNFIFYTMTNIKLYMKNK